VPHSASATTRAWGNADCSPRLDAGRPKNAAFAGVSAKSRRVPSIATSRRPASHNPGLFSFGQGARHAGEEIPHGLEPQPGPRLKIADFDGVTQDSDHPEDHESPSVSCANISS
jgi:hypothetical protein